MRAAAAAIHHLSVQSGDLRADAGQWARRAESGPSVAVEATGQPGYAEDAYPFRSFHQHLPCFDAFGSGQMVSGERQQRGLEAIGRRAAAPLRDGHVVERAAVSSWSSARPCAIERTGAFPAERGHRQDGDMSRDSPLICISLH